MKKSPLNHIINLETVQNWTSYINVIKRCQKHPSVMTGKSFSSFLESFYTPMRFRKISTEILQILFWTPWSQSFPKDKEIANVAFSYVCILMNFRKNWPCGFTIFQVFTYKTHLWHWECFFLFRVRKKIACLIDIFAYTREKLPFWYFLFLFKLRSYLGKKNLFVILSGGISCV